MFEEVDIQLKPHFFKQYLKLIGMRLLMTAVEADKPDAKPLYIYQKC